MGKLKSGEWRKHGVIKLRALSRDRLGRLKYLIWSNNFRHARLGSPNIVIATQQPPHRVPLAPCQERLDAHKVSGK